ncbi:hypothetical protein Pmani_019731 [Petrolisthes manimaculis]|uniref:JmjC domain-containing protein n=1 Tax=Petrolisthes manimaculis TaxID=1843537 RepID=A0AAE1PJ12_9EUCA|nr:hypothetical protein Pmani_019731 [Petrolisthes manimaculis]
MEKKGKQGEDEKKLEREEGRQEKEQSNVESEDGRVEREDCLMEVRERKVESEDGRVERENCLMEVVEGELNMMKERVETALRPTSDTGKQKQGESWDKRKGTEEEEWGTERGGEGMKMMKRDDKGFEVDDKRESGASHSILSASPSGPHKADVRVEEDRKSGERGSEEEEANKGEGRQTVPGEVEEGVKWRLPSGIESDVVGAWVSDTLSTLLQEVVDPPSSPTSDSLVVASCLLEYTWQQLNIGHWRDVSMSWRLVFTWGSVSLANIQLRHLQISLQCHPGPPSLDDLVAAGRIVKACDRGLLMGGPLDNNPLHSTAAALNVYARPREGRDLGDDEKETLPTEPEDPAEVTHPLPSEHCPALDRFLLKYMDQGRAVVLLGVVDHWPALHRWSLGYLQRVAGARTVPVEVGARYTDDSWYQRLMSLDDYITTYVMGRGRAKEEGPGYLAQHQLLDQIPQLQEDILVPDYCYIGDISPRLHAWFGPRGTVSPLHHDPDHNILVQVVGYKYVRLYSEDQTPYLYPHPDPLLSNTSQVDVEACDAMTTWPLLKEAKYYDLVLRPGQALYIPPRSWHYVRSLSISFSVSFWWT